MKRLLLVGEQVCRTFKANNLAAEIQSTVATVDIEKERQYMDLKRKIEAVRFDFRRRKQERHTFAYLTIKKIALHALHVHFGHFADVLVLSTTWNDLFCSCVDDSSWWLQMFNFVFLPLKRLFQSNPRTVRAHFASTMTLNNCKMIAETRSYIIRWRSRCRRRRLSSSSQIPHHQISHFFVEWNAAVKFKRWC